MAEQISIILHTQDKGTIEELAGTTETETYSGRIIYHTPVKDRDHQTDSIRACIRAIQRTKAASENYQDYDPDSDLGFFEVGGSEYGF